MKWTRYLFLLIFTLSTVTNCGSSDSGSAGTTVTALDLAPATLALAAGTSATLTATATLSDQTRLDVTSTAVWTSSDVAVATVAGGKVSALKLGATTITAQLGDLTKTTAVTVSSAKLVSLGITPASPTLAKGVSQQLTAMGVFSDMTTQDLTTQVAWTSDAPEATVSPSGLLRGAAVGFANISAKLGEVSATTKATITDASLVSIALTPPSPSLAKGTTAQLTATATFSDTTTQDITAQAVWVSSAPANVSLSATTPGLITAADVGTSTISASMNGVTGSTVATVTAGVLVSIGVTPATPTVAKGLTKQFTATGVFSDATTQDLSTQVTWASSDTTKATISNAAGSKGLASTAGVGTTTISATLGAVSGNTTLTVSAAALVSIGVTPATPTVAKGLTKQFSATGTYTDATTQDLSTQVTWASSDTTKATISNAAGSNGLASSAGVGTTTISATLGAVSGNTTLTVSAAALVSIGVTPATPTVAKGLTLQFSATGTYTDATTQDLSTQVTWASSDTTKATISNAAGSNGLASSAGVGTTTISATLGAVSGSTLLTVTPATLSTIAVTPATPSVGALLTQQFTATGTYTDATTQDLTTQATWASSDTTKATISNAAGSNGLASTVAKGATTISATLGAVSGNTVLTVTGVATFVPGGSGNTGTIQTFTVPAGITSVQIDASGAQGGLGGGGSGNGGARMIGTFTVTPGQVLKVLVGQRGTNGANDGSGGGGSFVTDSLNNPLVVAGGGGGTFKGSTLALSQGTTATSGQSTGIAAGTGGNGAASGHVGGGAGLLTNASPDQHGSSVALAFVNGGTGGSGTGVNGGFGGGGATVDNGSGGAGGGGYSGGAPGDSHSGPGGGGGSFNGGTAQTNTSGANLGVGNVIVTY